MANTEEKIRTGLFISKPLLDECDTCWKAYGYTSRNEFVNCAIKHFVSVKKMGEVDEATVERLGEAIAKASDDGIVKISKGLFRYAVVQEMILQILTKICEIHPDDVSDMRRQAIRDVRRMRGKVSLEQIADFRHEYDPQRRNLLDDFMEQEYEAMVQETEDDDG